MAKILTIRMSEQVGGIGVAIECGNDSIERQIASGEGLVRLAVVFADDGRLTDAEVTTQKISQ